MNSFSRLTDQWHKCKDIRRFSSMKYLYRAPRKITSHVNYLNSINIRNCSCLQQDVDKQQLRYNPIKIQMLSQDLHQQIFGKESGPNIDPEVLSSVKEHLSTHGLLDVETTTLPDVNFRIPKLHNSNIIDHFTFIATQLLQEYKKLLRELLNSEILPPPKIWEFKEGWTKYHSSGHFESVDYPDESAIVFDVEVCMQDGNYPTIATAVSNKHWYLWCSKRLVENEYSWSKNAQLSDLIPLETSNNEKKSHQEWKPRLVVGHNVAFDRAFVKEQYYLDQTKAMFLDTMSLHMCVSGLTGMQRSMSMATKKNPDPKSQNFFTVMGWSDISSLNNLADVYKLYCEEELQKTKREIFVTGSLADVKANFQDLATYCATDTLATYKVLKKVMAMFFERFPHPVTLYGLLEMSTAYLPVNQNWEKYIRESQATYDDLQKELKLSLMHVANDACSLLHNDLYKKDPWLWDLNWATQDVKFRKAATQPKKKKKKQDVESIPEVSSEMASKLDEEESPDSIKSNSSEALDPALKHIYESATSLRKIRPFLPGYPLWYRDLCDKNYVNNPDWEPGPILISCQMRCVPKLMRMTWDGYPLHYDAAHGWGYLVPNIIELDSVKDGEFPLKSLLNILYYDNAEEPEKSLSNSSDHYWPRIKEPKEDQEYKYWRAILSTVPSNKTELDSEPHHGIGPHDVGIEGCDFFRLPHKDGLQKRVGNPLSKDFLPKVEDGTLRTWGKGQADRALLLSKMLSYWKNAHGRIKSQMVVWFNHDELPTFLKKNENYDEGNSYGAILPRLIPAGTVTRRAVEPTWLTASNAYGDRLGSELKSMVQSPPGYHFVGADVDSQELWLAALFGDSHFAKCHGATAFGWMTLQGKKSSGTDMHSKTAASVGIDRDKAKILNYARIYGAGRTFAQRLLMQFNHRLTAEEAQKKVKKMYSETKGVQKILTKKDKIAANGYVSNHGDQKKIWVGGSESHMFNKLEEIALSKTPSTPALNCRISRALEPRAVDTNFMTSKVNWVVQSSAVDFLHLMLVCMRWLFNEYNIQGRYSICIHDEVRYLVRSEDRYRAALALQITNLLTRSFFTAKVGMNDLPQSVAFFSSVDIDTVLRKEVHMDSKTPSNPHGLHKGYGVPPGEALDIFGILQKTNGGSFIT